MGRRRAAANSDDGPGAWLWNHRYGLAATIVVVVAAGLRFWRLGFQSVWLDEAYSIDWSKHDYGWILELAKNRDIHPPEYYFLLHNWMPVFGDSEAAVRALSALLGVFGVAAVYWLGRDLVHPRVGLIAAALVAVAEFHIKYSQEARSYALLFAMSVLSMHAYWLCFGKRQSASGVESQRPMRDRTTRGDEAGASPAGSNKGAAADAVRGSGRRWLLLAYYVVATLALLHAHTMAIFVVAAQVVHRVANFALLRPFDRRAATEWFAAQAVTALLYLPWFLVLLGQAGRLQGGFWIPEPTLETAGRPPDYSVGGTVGLFIGDGLRAAVSGFLLLNAVLPWTLGGLNLKKWDGGPLAYRTYPTSALALLGLWFLFSLFGPFVQSLVSQPVYLARITIAALAPILLVAAVGVARVRFPAVQVGAVALVAVLGVPSLADYYSTPAKEDWRGLVSYVQGQATPGATVVVLGSAVFPFSYYLNHTANGTSVLPDDPARSDIRVLRADGASAEQRAALREATAGARDVFLVVRQPTNDYQTLGQELSQGRSVVATKDFVPEGRGLAANAVSVARFVA